jgi:hypothetical protein
MYGTIGMFCLLPTGLPPGNTGLTGTVVSVDGIPIPDVRVELWIGVDRLAAAKSDQSGQFRFEEPLKAGTMLLARRIGFEPARVQVHVRTDTMTVVMHELAASLPEVAIVEAKRLCPNRDEPAARNFWDESRHNYASGLRHGRGADFTGSYGIVDRQNVGSFEGAHPTSGSRAYSAAGVAGVRYLLSKHGYVRLEPPIHSDRDFGVYWYAPLAAEYAEHFADSLFGAFHTFSIVSEETSESIIAYCPKDRRYSGLEGTLRISTDGEFVEARWRYWNPMRDAEEAGGDALFAPRDPNQSDAILVPAAGTFWRRLRSGMFYQVHQEYSKWTVLDDG